MSMLRRLRRLDPIWLIVLGPVLVLVLVTMYGLAVYRQFLPWLWVRGLALRLAPGPAPTDPSTFGADLLQPPYGVV